MIYGRDRRDIRRLFVDIWGRRSRGEQLPAFERSVAEVIAAHPEYHAMLANPEIVERDFPVEAAGTNPFLHMGMHIAIVEQVTTDRPPGIRGLYNALLSACGDAHGVEHAMMDCLGECLWEAERNVHAPDEQRYLECVRNLAGKLPG